ncbi:ATP-binding protein [Cloacibacillus sp. An23]|uniref:ATP-binding protein n=1 Tax=Cloacibacillus sp. An23 TaxID=1965591 RepID=UPI00194FDB96|nr:ATP-binding protein [Cloacibacillus sp. An23]
MAFRKAERRQAKLRLGLIGPSGSGKTYGALLIAQGLGGKIALIDSENGSGELYADMCDYDVCQLAPEFTPQKYIAAIHEAERAGYDVIIIDSLSHAWAGAGGVLEMVDKRKGRGNDFAAWRDVTPQHNALVDAMLQSPCHIIATMRSKTAYDMEKDERTGKIKPVKIGLAPVQREGMDYEFTVVLEIDQQKHMAEATKDRTSLFDGEIFKITPETGEKLRAWLETGLPAETVRPNKTQAAPKPLTEAQQAQRTLIGMLTDDAGLGLRKDECGAWIKQTLGRDIKSMSELELGDIEVCIQAAQDAIGRKVA